MIYFFSLYVLKNFCAFPSRYRLYVSGIIAMLNFPDVVNRKLLPVFLFPFGTAKVETFFTFSKFIFTYFLSDPFRRFPAFFNTFTPSFAGCKG
ncbi:hypothetical protein, partial [Mucilaginibacter boryungensis]|uniref:hypothetical protein n=1 Tax=Mucilaginibacter boryungensis TaxID=768480 RepID=UPI001D16A801